MEGGGWKVSSQGFDLEFSSFTIKARAQRAFARFAVRSSDSQSIFLRALAFLLTPPPLHNCYRSRLTRALAPWGLQGYRAHEKHPPRRTLQ